MSAAMAEQVAMRELNTKRPGYRVCAMLTCKKFFTYALFIGY